MQSFKKTTENKLKKQYLKPMFHTVTPVLHFNEVFCILNHFSVSEVLIKYTMTTISIYYSKPVKYCYNYFKIQRSATEKLVCIFRRHKMTYQSSFNACKVQLFVGSMQNLGDCLFLFFLLYF